MHTSKRVRQIFTEFFLKQQFCKHLPVKPVRHFRDPSVPALNFGLTQIADDFKDKYRTVGFMKCVVDCTNKEYLNIVGTDEYNHTLQEVYTNCSFASDSKQAACEAAYKLLTEEYKLDKRSLKISCYGGDPALPISANQECKELWKSLGISQESIISGTENVNFYEMGGSNLCGSTSEIYYIHPNGSLRELWNIMFITHERNESGQLTKLDAPFTLSGMHLESLTAVAQSKLSNYDTDLFQPIITAIQQNSPRGVSDYQGKFGPEAYMDVAYRKLADHARTISISLADEIAPSTNLSLQNVMHEAFSISEKVFMHPPGFLQDLFHCITDILGEYYPEMHTKEYYIKELLGSEENIYKSKEVASSKTRAYFTPSWFDDEEVFNQRISELFYYHHILDETSISNEMDIEYNEKLDNANKAANIDNTDTTGNMDVEVRRSSTKSVFDLIAQELLLGIQDAIASKRQYMVHFLACSYLMEYVNLSKDVFEISEIPVMLFACCNGVMKVACMVPKPLISPCFNAKNWISQVTPVFDSVVDPAQNDQDMEIFASMKGIKVSLINCESLVQRGMKEAIDYIQTNLPQHPELPDKRSSLPWRKLSKES